MPPKNPPPSRTRLMQQGLIVLLASLPVLTLLAHVGLIRTTTPIPTRQLSAESGLLRVKKLFVQEYGPGDHPHLTVLHLGQPLLRKPFALDLAQSHDAVFWGKDFVLYIKPPPGQYGEPVTEGAYAVRRPWRTSPSLWWAWGAASGAALLIAGRRGLLANIRSEVSTHWRTVEGTLTLMQHRTAWHVALAAISLVFIAVSYMDKVSSPYLVAEDAPVFLTDSLTQGARALVMPYAGYLHALPRLVATLATPLPLEHFPTVVLYICLAMMGIITFCIARWLLDWREQLTVVGFICMAPFGGYLMLSMTNLQWFSGTALALLAVHPDPTPKSIWGKATLIALATLMALTGPFAIVTLPVFICMAIFRRTHFLATLAATQMGPALLQLAIVIDHDPPVQQAPDPTHSPVLSWLADFVLGLFGKPSWLAGIPDSGKLFLGILLIGILVGGLCYSLRRERFPSRLLLLQGLATLFAAVGWLRSNGLSQPWLHGDRYFVVPYALLLVALASLLKTTSAPRSLRFLALFVLITCQLGYRDSLTPSLTVPDWREQVAKIPAGGSAFIKTWPPIGDWSVLLARDPNGHWLRGEPYRQVTSPR